MCQGRKNLMNQLFFISLTLSIGPENNLFLSQVMFNQFLIITAL